jgi:hypothetical protein
MNERKQEFLQTGHFLRAMERCPRQESNLRTRFRKPLLYPLSYGGVSWLQYAVSRLHELSTGAASECSHATEITPHSHLAYAALAKLPTEGGQTDGRQG